MRPDDVDVMLLSEGARLISAVLTSPAAPETVKVDNAEVAVNPDNVKLFAPATAIVVILVVPVPNTKDEVVVDACLPTVVKLRVLNSAFVSTNVVTPPLPVRFKFSEVLVVPDWLLLNTTLTGVAVAPAKALLIVSVVKALSLIV